MRARITFSKTGALRYIGHLDLQTLWERTARRAGLSLAYSNGFHPQPKITFASALPLGFSSRAEVMDIRLKSDIAVDRLPGLLQKALPAGISVLDARVVDDSAPPLQMQVRSAQYEVTLLAAVDFAAVRANMERVLAASSLPRTRREKQYDLRPLIEDLHMMEPGVEAPGPHIFMQLSSREAATGRPEELLSELGIPANDTRIERTRLIFAE